MTEKWKVIKEFPNNEISNEGRVRNTKSGRILRVKDRKVCLYDPETQKSHRRSVTFLMNQYWKFEWIKELDDDEECKVCYCRSEWFVTTKGRIYSTLTNTWLKTSPVKNRYYRSVGKMKDHYLHTLVGRTFLSEYKEGLLILHKEETLPYPQVNYLSNLWVGTSSDNNKDTYVKGRWKNQYG